jgi:TonB family protein
MKWFTKLRKAIVRCRRHDSLNLQLKTARVSIAYLPMRVFGFAAVLLLSVVNVGRSEVDVPSTQSAALPMFRPVLIGIGPDALINRIDAADLVSKGQKDAAVMFSCTVTKTGQVVLYSTYRGTPDSKLLEQEMLKKLSAAANPKFVPAVYNHLPVDAIYYGTVTFMVVDGKPRLRIFSNQELEEVKKESDFIGPQPFFGADSKFTGFHYPATTAPVPVDGAARLELKVDESGNLRDIKVLGEAPPFLGFGDAALADLAGAKFIPAFRDGKPVASDVTLPVFYKEKGF